MFFRIHVLSINGQGNARLGYSQADECKWPGADALAISFSALYRTRSNLICPGAGQAARASDAVLACSAVAAELVVPTAFLVAAVLFAIRAVFRGAADCSEVAVRVSREDSLADSRALEDYWAVEAVVVSLLVAYFRAVSKHSDSDAQPYLERPPDAAARSDGSRSDLVPLQLRVRA